MIVNVLPQFSSTKEASKNFDDVRKEMHFSGATNSLSGLEWRCEQKKNHFLTAYFKHWGANLFAAIALKNCITRPKQGKML